MRSGIVLLALLVLFTFTASGCNLYSSLDQPSTATQRLEAARACFDQGNFPCASKYYAQISTSDASYDEATAEAAFEVLDQYGISAVNFMTAVLTSTGNAGKIITLLAN